MCNVSFRVDGVGGAADLISRARAACGACLSYWSPLMPFGGLDRSRARNDGSAARALKLPGRLFLKREARALLSENFKLTSS